MILDYRTAKNNLLASSIDGCQQFFEKNGNILELAYCDIISENLETAKERFSSIYNSDIRAKWGHFLVNLIQGKVEEYPTYFELRNFLEIDINILISYYKGNYVEKIVAYADFMFSINPEVHKFIGRVFYNNKLKPQAMFFLERAKTYFYQDPELHYLLATFYFEENDFKNALKATNNCLNVLPNYFPAVNIKKKIEEKLSQ